MRGGGGRGHGRRHGRDHDHGAEGGGRKRVFNPGELALLLLHLTGSSPKHGYELIQEIEALTGGAYAPSPGIIYPTLSMLEELGHIERQAVEGSRRIFALAAAGRVRLAEQSSELKVVLSKLTAFQGKDAGDGDLKHAAPVWRALQNLRAVLQQRLLGAAERRLLLEIADLIDEVARKIERL